MRLPTPRAAGRRPRTLYCDPPVHPFIDPLMAAATVASLLLLIITTVIHYEALRKLAAYLPEAGVRPRARLMVVIVVAFFAHMSEMLAYGIAYYILVAWMDIGALGASGVATLAEALYFSAETYTSLGYGDIVPYGPMRLVAGVEALNGLLLIGWSASFIYISMERYWRLPVRRRHED